MLIAVTHYSMEQFMEPTLLKSKILDIESKRDALVQLLEQPDLGTLRIDVNQALEELDELVDDLKQTFPENN
ncbi:MAG: hypothetical protein AAGA75_27405 [Cyanobacteria bacterium P01_E01_bin.6]